MKLKMKQLFVLLFCIFCLQGCGSDSNLEKVNIEPKSFNLRADPETKIIYILNPSYYGYEVYTPYYSKNGKLCRYIDGEIVEIEDTENEEE